MSWIRMGNYTYVVENRSMQDSAREEFQAALQSVGVNRFLGEKGVDLKEYAAVAARVPVGEDVILGKDGINNFLYTYVMVFVLYFLILFLWTDDRYIHHDGEEQPGHRDPGDQCGQHQPDLWKSAGRSDRRVRFRQR